MIFATRARRWVAVAGLVAVLSALPPLISALPAAKVAIAPLELLRAIRSSSSVPYRGLAESNAQLGLPDFEAAGRVTSLLGQKTRLRAWYRGPYGWRVDELSPVGEHGTYGDNGGIWVWDSGRRTATRVNGFPEVRFPRAADMLPPELARRLADGARPSEISGLPAKRVAGIDAAGLRITPSTPDTTVASVDIWADPRSGLPLRVEVGARGAVGTIVSSQFLEVSEEAPPPSVLVFHPPHDAFVSRVVAPDFAQVVATYSPFVLPGEVGARGRTTRLRAAAVYGRGFDTIAVLALPEQYSPFSHDELSRLRPVGGPWTEGYLARTPLLNALLVEARSVLYMLGGAVTPKALIHAARGLVRHPLPVQRRCC
jgi:outer membrane lipoprotein-sorting protein